MDTLTSYPVVLGAVGAAAAYMLLAPSSAPVIKKPFVASNIATTTDELDKVIERVSQNAQKWVDVSLERKLEYLKEMLLLLNGVAEAAGNASTKIRHLDEAQAFSNSGRMYSSGMVSSTVRGYIELYESLVKTGTPPAPVSVRQVQDVEVAQTGPRGVWQKITNPAVIELLGRKKKRERER